MREKEEEKKGEEQGDEYEWWEEENRGEIMLRKGFLPQCHHCRSTR